jgi:hypothetical protein
LIIVNRRSGRFRFSRGHWRSAGNGLLGRSGSFGLDATLFFLPGGLFAHLAAARIIFHATRFFSGEAFLILGLAGTGHGQCLAASLSFRGRQAKRRALGLSRAASGRPLSLRRAA